MYTFHDFNRQRRVNLALLVISLILGLGLLALFMPAEAQAQTLVRPAKGEAQLLWDNVSVLGSSKTYGPLDWTGYAGMQVIVEMYNAADTCARLPSLQIEGAATARSSGVTLPAPDAYYRVPEVSTRVTHTYAVNVPTPYARFLLTGHPTTSGSTDCRVSVWIIPLPEDPAQAVAAVVKAWGRIDLTASMVQSVGGTPGSPGGRKLTIQNQGTVPVVCGFSRTVTAAQFAFSLAAGTATNDGTAGSWSDDFQGVVYCLAVGGAGAISYYLR